MRKDAADYAQLYELLRSVARHKTVPEPAAGTGLIAKNIVSSAARIETTDASGEMIAGAKRDSRSSKLPFSVQDMFRLPYADGSFDGVIVANALRIVPEPELGRIPVKRAIIDGGITPCQLPYPVRRLLLWRDIASFKAAANSRKIPEAAFPPGHAPEKEYDAMEGYLKTFSDRTIRNVFWSANNYALPKRHQR